MYSKLKAKTSGTCIIKKTWHYKKRKEKLLLTSNGHSYPGNTRAPQRDQWEVRPYRSIEPEARVRDLHNIKENNQNMTRHWSKHACLPLILKNFNFLTAWYHDTMQNSHYKSKLHLTLNVSNIHLIDEW